MYYLSAVESSFFSDMANGFGLFPSLKTGEDPVLDTTWSPMLDIAF
jgi:hypothetical protein